MRVFVLEDSHSRNVLFREIFADLSIDFYQTDNVVEAACNFKGDYDIILLDHDLEESHYDKLEECVGKPGTGSEFASWLAETQKPSQGPIVIHSYNPPGAEHMYQTLTKAGWHVYKQPFGLVLLEKLKKFVKESLDNHPVSE